MRDLAGIAEREGSDIVLGRLGGIGGRRTPGAVFAKTVYDADLVENRVFNTLSAVKLFRTELLHRTGALHPTSLRIGSDQPFVATLFLAAGKVSICADRDYVLIRTREDGTNITSTRRTPQDYMDLLVLLIPVIVAGTEPGAFRDGLLRRPFRNTLTKSMRTGFLALDEATQQRVVDQLRETITPLYNEATAAHLDALTRTKVELALDGDVEALREVMGWEAGVGHRQLVHTGESFVLDLPAGLRKRLGEHRMHAVDAKADVTLRRVSADGSTLRVEARAIALGATEPPDDVRLRLVNRWSEESIEVEATDARRVDTSSGTGRDLGAEVDLGPLAHGVWDAHLVQKFGSAEVVTRLGSKRRKGFIAEPVHVFANGEGGEALGKAYYTRGRGYLSLDVGYTQTGNALPEVEVRGVVASADGPRLAVVSVASDDSPEFFVSRVSELGKDRRRIASSAVDSQLFLLEIPSDLPLEDNSAGLVVRADGEERTLGWSDRVMTARGPRPADSSERWRDDETSVDVLRHSMYGILVVGRRAFQKIRKAVARRHQA